MTTFDEMIDEVVGCGVAESAVVSNYFLVNYPYLQCVLDGTPVASSGRMESISEVSPPGWKGTTKAMKKNGEISNPFALAWYMKNRGAKPHYKSKAPFRRKQSD